MRWRFHWRRHLSLFRSSLNNWLLSLSILSLSQFKFIDSFNFWCNIKILKYLRLKLIIWSFTLIVFLIIFHLIFRIIFIYFNMIIYLIALFFVIFTFLFMNNFLKAHLWILLLKFFLIFIRLILLNFLI